MAFAEGSAVSGSHGDPSVEHRHKPMRVRYQDVLDR